MIIKNVSVLGTGEMGRQIALQIANSGFKVSCYDNNEKAVEKAVLYADNWYMRAVEKNKFSKEESDLLRKNLSFTSKIEESCKNADIVIEAVPDILEVKRDVLAMADRYTPGHAIFASNSSYIVSSKFCDVVGDSSKVCNMHFFNPALVMKIVELVKGPHTSEETINSVYTFAQNIAKEPIVINKEIYGFVVNRIFSALTREACYLVDSGIASPKDIDTAVKGALGHPMGPFELLDMTGIDLEYNVYMEKFRNSGNIADLPAVCISEKYFKNELGRKLKLGFYSYK